nr:immunoglobulin light chain junction region [Macaca mulatta]
DYYCCSYTTRSAWVF